jgi:proteasome-associated ATPase
MSDAPQEGKREFDLLDRIDLLIASLPPGDMMRRDLLDLRLEISEREETFVEARQMIEKLEEVIKKVTSPANRIGTFLGSVSKETAHIVVGGADYYCNVDPRIQLGKLKKGTRVLVNEAFVIVGDLGFELAGPVTKITEVIGDDRLRVGDKHGTQSLVLQRSAELAKTSLKQGDEVRVDSNYRMALEMMSAPGSHEHHLDAVPHLPWTKVGGQEPAISAIKDAIELPLLYPELFAKFQHATPKGFLLYGPPGCGKTLIGKATAYNLTKQLREKGGGDTREYFMHVKGPEILNMWVGESERMVREIFATAREKRREGFMPFLFIDEAESILGTRRASRYSNILSTLVPMFCSEMDGIDSLNDVVIILASNRADLIDPAILRPGRIDRKIKIDRPNKEGAKEIYRIYLTNDLPYDGALAKEAENIGAAIDKLIERFVDWQFARRDDNKFLEVTLRSGRKEILYRSDLISGAIIASVVERAKGRAIKRAIADSVAALAPVAAVAGRGERSTRSRGHPERTAPLPGHPERSEAESKDPDEVTLMEAPRDPSTALGMTGGGISEPDLQIAFETEDAENDIFPPTDITEDWLKLIDYDPENVVKIAPVRANFGQRIHTLGGVI